MDHRHLHDWALTPEQAIAIQKELRSQVRIEDDFGQINTIAGVDLSFGREDAIGHAIVVLVNNPQDSLLEGTASDSPMGVVEAQYATAPIPLPYIPGLLSFRESPIALKAFEKLETRPDVVMLDGQGIAHPRGFGIACHIGLLLDVPTIGVAKSFLYGDYDRSALGEEALSQVPMRDKRGNVIGAVLRTRRNGNPLFISPGHRMSVESATRLVIDSLRGYRLPEPTRLAHNMITEYKKGLEETDTLPN